MIRADASIPPKRCPPPPPRGAPVAASVRFHFRVYGNLPSEGATSPPSDPRRGRAPSQFHKGQENSNVCEKFLKNFGTGKNFKNSGHRKISSNNPPNSIFYRTPLSQKSSCRKTSLQTPGKIRHRIVPRCATFASHPFSREAMIPKNAVIIPEKNPVFRRELVR